MSPSAAPVPARVQVRPHSLLGGLPSVTVVVPCFNYGRFLTQAVRSALTQSGVEVRVVIVDDASTDDSADIAASLTEDTRVRLLRNATNRGPVVTFNRGLAAVESEFLVRLDADDLLTPGSLERSAAVARAFPSVGLVYGHPVHFAGTPPSTRQRVSRWTVWPGRQWVEARCRSGVNVITSPEAFLRSEVVHRVGGQRDLAHTHDMEMWLRLALHSDVAYLHGADQAWHREHPASLSLRAQSPGGLVILRERRDAFLTSLSEDTAGTAALRRTARQTLAREALFRASYEIDRGRYDAGLTAELIAFAEETSPDAHQLPGWTALQRRLGSVGTWTVRRPWLLARPFIRIGGNVVQQRRWRRTGGYERG